MKNIGYTICIVTVAVALSAWSGDLAWKGTDLAAWTVCSNSIRSFAVSDEGLVAKMSDWRDACIETVLPSPIAVGPEHELVFRAKAICPSSGRVSPEGKVNPLYVGMRDYAAWASMKFIWRVDGEWHEYAFRPFDDANGRQLKSLKIRLPPEGRSTGVITFGEIILRHRPAAPCFEVLSAEADGFARAGKTVELRVRVANGGTSAMKNAKLSLAAPLPDGVRMVKPASVERTIERDGTVTMRVLVQSESAASFKAAFSLEADGVAAKKVEIPVDIAAAPVAQKAACVPEPRPVKTDYEIAACYYPGWRERESWKRVSRVCPERKPLLGWYDERNPEAVDWQIKWYVEHGIGIVMLDWYWTRKLVNDYWVHAFAKAKHRRYVKWMVVWCNESQKKGVYSVDDFRKVVRHWVENYFTMPEYYRIGGKPAVGLFVPEYFVRDIGEAGTKQMLVEARESAKAAGFGGIHFIGYARPADDVDAQMLRKLRDLGFDEAAWYNCRGCETKDGRADRYAWSDTTDFNLKSWDLYAKSGVPFWPIASSGWDDRPWNSGLETYGRNKRDFRRVLEGLKAFADKTGRKRLMIGPINEWGEGSFIEPNVQFGFGMYDAIRDVFCEKPSDGWPEDVVPEDVGLGPYDLPDDDPDPKVSEPMDLKDGRLHGWKPLRGHVASLTPTSEGLHVVPMTKTPAIICNYERFEAADYARLVVNLRMKNVFKGGGLHVYWKCEGVKWCEQCSISASKFKLDGGSREYVLDLSAVPGWKGKIEGVRVQFASSTPAEFVVEAVRFERHEQGEK